MYRITKPKESKLRDLTKKVIKSGKSFTKGLSGIVALPYTAPTIAREAWEDDVPIGSDIDDNAFVAGLGLGMAFVTAQLIAYVEIAQHGHKAIWFIPAATNAISLGYEIRRYYRNRGLQNF